MKEDWETKGKILYANAIIPTTTLSPDSIATTIDEISEDENEVNSTTFTLFSLNTTEKIELTTCSEAEQLTTQLCSVNTEAVPEIPNKETNQDVTVTKTRISYRPVGFLGRNNTLNKFKFKHGFFSKPSSKNLQNKQVNNSNDQQDKSQVSVTTVCSIKRDIRSVQQADKTKDCNELNSDAMKQLYSAMMADNFDPNKKKRENERDSDKSTSDFMSEGFWETPMTRIIGTGMDDVKVQFARPLVDNLNSLNGSDPDQLVDKDEPLQIISNEDHDKNIRFFEDAKHLQDSNDKYGYYKTSMKKKSGDFDLEQLMNWPRRWEEQNKKVYSSEQSKKTLQKWGKLAGKLQPIWDAVDEVQHAEVSTEFKDYKENALISYESKTLPLNDAEKYKSQQSSNLETLDSIRKTNEMQRSNMEVDVDHLQSNEKSSGWREQNQLKNKALLWDPTLHLQNTKFELSNVDMGEKLNRDRQSKNNSIVRRPTSNGFDRNYETDELINPSSKAERSKWESSAGRNHMIEFSDSPNPSVELQQLLNARNPLIHRNANKMQDYRKKPNLSMDESRSKWELSEVQRSQQKWGRGEVQKPTMTERPTNWDRAHVNKLDVLQSNGEIDDEQNKFMEEQQSKWDNIEIDDAQNKPMKEYQSKSENREIEDSYNKSKKQQSKWENIEVEDASNKFTKGRPSNKIWELPNIVDPSARESQLKSEPSDVKNPQENTMQWKFYKNPTLREYKQKWSSQTMDDPQFAGSNPLMWPIPKFQEPSESIYQQNQVPFVGGLSSKSTHLPGLNSALNSPSGEFPSKWQEPAYYNPSAVISNTNWDQTNVPGFVGYQSKWSNLHSLNSKDSEMVGNTNAMLNELSVQPNFEFPMPQNYSYKESQHNLRNSMGIVVPNMKWDNVNLQTCSLTDDSLPIKGSNSNDHSFKDVTDNQESLMTKSVGTVMSPGKMFKDNVCPDTVINNKQYLFDKKTEILNPVKNSINAFKERQQINYTNSILPTSNRGETVGQSNLQITPVKGQIKLETTQLENQEINVGHFKEPTNLSSIWTQDSLNDWHSNSQNLDGEHFNQSRSLAYKLNHEQEDTLNPQFPSCYESYINPEFINSTNPISAESQLDYKNGQIIIDQSSDKLQKLQYPLAYEIGTNGRISTGSESLNLLNGQSQPMKEVSILQNYNWLQENPMNMKHFNGLSHENRPLKELNASSQFVGLNYRDSNYEKALDPQNLQINHSQSKWKSENIQNPSLRDIQRQWDTVNYVSNPITAESQLHWEHNSLEGELDPQQNVPNLQTLEQESIDDRSQDIAKETQNLSSNSVKLSKLHARTTGIKNMKTPVDNLDKQAGGVSESNLDTSNIKNTELKSEKCKSAETNSTQIKSDNLLKNSSSNENSDKLENDKLKKIVDNSMKVKLEDVNVGKVKIRGNYKIQNSLDDVKTNNPDVANFVENPNECDQKDKDIKRIRSSEKQYSEKSKNKKLELNTGINVDVDDIIVCDSPLTYDNKDSEEEYYKIQKNKDGKQRRNKSKVIQSKVRSNSDIQWKKNWKISRQNVRNRIVSKTNKRKMVPPINITIAMKNLFNRVSPSEVSVRNSSTLESDGSFKFSIELKDKMAKFYKRSIENLKPKNETVVRNIKK